MNMVSTIQGERIAARHCDELVRRGPRPEEREASLAAWKRDLRRRLARDVGALLSGEAPGVRIEESGPQRGADVIGRIAPVAANSLLRCGAGDRTALLSFDLATALALTERSFGGTGEIAADTPESLPRSAALLIDKAAAIIARALAAASLGEEADPAAIAALDADVIVRSESAVRLKPFAPEADCLVFTVTFEGEMGLEWSALIAFAEPVFERLLPGAGTPAAGSGDGKGANGRGRADPAASPFGAIPLPIEGVLAEIDMSLARLERLRPGDRIPLAVPGEMQLRIGEVAIGHGLPGTLEDRIALRLTRIAPPGSAHGGREAGRSKRGSQP